MTIKTYFKVVLLCLVVGLFSACADENLANDKKENKPVAEVKGVKFTTGAPKMQAKLRSVVDDEGKIIPQTSTRTFITHEIGKGADAFWDANDYIWVKDKNNVWQKSIAIELHDGGSSAEFTLPGTPADYNDGCEVYYTLTEDPFFKRSATIPAQQTQAAPNNFSQAGRMGDGGTAFAHATGNPVKFNFVLEHHPHYLCFLPRCENAQLAPNIRLMKVKVEEETAGRPIGAIYRLTPGLYDQAGLELRTKEITLTLTPTNGFAIAHTTKDAINNACYITILSGTRQLKIDYTIKDPTTNIETTVTKRVSGTFSPGGITDVTAWIDKDWKGTHADYYLWGAQEPVTKDVFQLTPGDPQMANLANTIPNALFSTLPNANELCWYAYKGDVHWGQSLDIYVINGHLKPINGIWLKKKAKILADEHISASYMENGYPRFDNNVYKDWRNTFWEAGLPAAAYPKLLVPKATPVPNTQDYFFLPLLGANSWGTNISGIDESGWYWSSSSPALQIAWLLDIYSQGVKVITGTKYQAGYVVKPFP